MALRDDKAARAFGKAMIRDMMSGEAARYAGWIMDITQETKTQRRELGSGQFLDFGNGVAHGQHQPISGGVENEADLIGECRTATGAV